MTPEEIKTTVAVNQFKEQLAKAEQRVAELIAELEHIREQKNLLWFEFSIATQQLAASQLRETKMRKLLGELGLDAGRSESDLDKFQQYVEIDRSYVKKIRKALAIPTDTSALDAYVSEKVKEAWPIVSSYPDQNTELRRQLTELTRQRDLAVSELETVATGFDCDNDAHRYGSYCRKCEATKALSTIKGEVKE